MNRLVPGPPGWTVDWDAAWRAVPWAPAMAACPQAPDHHGEGDVWTHTRLVVEALVALPGWRALAPAGRRVVFLAALLHDVAKPERTRLEDGRLRTPGHGRRGSLLARGLLWRAGLDLAEREAVCGLIRMHAVPLFALERPDPERLAVEASWVARADHLALLAGADARGRVAADRDDLVDRCELFLELCRDLGCVQTPYPFASDHARFRYFHTGRGHPTDAPPARHRCEALILSGLPAAGKDTWLQRHAPGRPVVSLDAIRDELDVEPARPQGAVVDAARKAVRAHLRAGEDFAWNATFVSRALRQRAVTLAAEYGARVRIVSVEAPEATLRERNRQRAAPVPDAVIDRLIDRWEAPDLTEAHAVERG